MCSAYDPEALPYTAKRLRGKTFAVFHLLTNIFPSNYGLVDSQYKSASMLP